MIKKINPSVESGVSPTSDYYFIADNYYTTLRKSTDGGLSFKEIVLDNTHFGAEWTLRTLAMYDTNYGFATNSFSYFITKDGWETFKKHDKKNYLESFYSPIFKDSNTVIMSYASNDNPNGMAFIQYHFKVNKWDTLSYFGFNRGSDQSANDFNRIYTLYFINDSLGFGSGCSRVHQGQKEYFDMIYKTTDGGYTWKTVFRELDYPEVGLNNNISFADEMNGIAVGRYGKIAMTNDGGDTWFYEPYPNEMKNCGKMQICWAGRTPLIGTWDRGIFRYEGDFFKFSEDTTGLEENISNSFNLYLNPSSDKVIIEIELNQTMLVNIEIFDVLGQKVKNYKSNTLNFGKNNLNIDVSDLTIGSYFININLGNKSISKRIIVMP